MIEPPKLIFYFYQLYQPLFDDMKEIFGDKIRFIQGAPSDRQIEDIIEQPIKPCAVVLDDMQQSLGRTIVNLFQAGSHHGRVSVLLLVQCLFDRSSPHMRSLSSSATNYILTKSPRDQTQIHHLGRQIWPGRGGDFVKVFQEATKKAYSCLHIDFTQTCPDFLRMKSNLFRDELPVKCWVLEHEMQKHISQSEL